VQVLMLAGAGKSFCAGADTEWMRGMAAASEPENREDALHLARMLRLLHFLSKPTLARVHGAAYGGGIGLIACCDIAIGADSATFALSEVRLGLVPATISPYVMAAIGARQARRLFVTGEVFDAARAAEIGLLHECVPDADLDASIERVLRALHRGAPQARLEAKRLALRVAGLDERESGKVDARNAELIARLRVGEEGQEGLSAFLDKRKPAWLSDEEQA